MTHPINAEETLFSGLVGQARRRFSTWLLIRGILAVVLGIILFISPAAGTAALALVAVISIGVWLIFEGIAEITGSLTLKREGLKGWGWVLTSGSLTVVAGVLALIFPLATGLTLGILVLWFLAIGLVVRGVLELCDRSLGGWGITMGVLNILFGLVFSYLVLTDPGATLLSVVWVGGIYGVIFGISAIVSAVRLRRGTSAS